MQTTEFAPSFLVSDGDLCQMLRIKGRISKSYSQHWESGLQEKKLDCFSILKYLKARNVALAYTLSNTQDHQIKFRKLIWSEWGFLLVTLFLWLQENGWILRRCYKNSKFSFYVLHWNKHRWDYQEMITTQSVGSMYSNV